MRLHFRTCGSSAQKRTRFVAIPCRQGFAGSPQIVDRAGSSIGQPTSAPTLPYFPITALLSFPSVEHKSDGGGVQG
jgi:hypothetical protein